MAKVVADSIPKIIAHEFTIDETNVELIVRLIAQIIVALGNSLTFVPYTGLLRKIIEIPPNVRLNTTSRKYIPV